MIHLLLVICFLSSFQISKGEEKYSSEKTIARELFNVPLQEEISFSFLLNSVVEELSIEEDTGMKRCYNALKANAQDIPLTDALEAIEGVLEILHRAPREDLSAPVVGPCTVGCNLAGLLRALKALRLVVLQCCSSLVNLTAEILETETLCCDAITGQFDAILAMIGTSSLSENFETTLTTCCASIQNQFQGTWTALEAIFACGATPITAAGTITAPGSYCLGNNIAGEIIINASNVTLDLKGYTISGGNNGITINGSNVVIQNGGITATTAAGISITAGNGSIVLQNITILDVGTVGVAVQTATDIVMETVSVTIAPLGFTIDSSTNISLRNCIATTVDSLGFGITGCTNVSVASTQAGAIDGGAVLGTGFNIVNSNQVSLNLCKVWNMSTTIGARGFVSESSSGVTHTQCYAGRYNSSGPIYAYYALNSADIEYVNCDCSGLTTTVSGAGVRVDLASFYAENATGCIYNGCAATDMIASLGIGCGFAFNNADSIVLRNCIAVSNIGAPGRQYGFYVTTGNTVYSQGVNFYNCIAAGTSGEGISLGQGTGNLYDCIVVATVGNGFEVNNGLGSPNGLWALNECLSLKNSANGFFNIVGPISVAPFNLYSAFNGTEYLNFPAVFTQGTQFNCVSESGGIPAAGNIAG